MSAVLQQTQKLYQKVMLIEGILVALLTLLLCIVSTHSALSFFLGSLASFLPFCLFTYWVFFRPHTTAKNTHKMTAFYRGEGLKWLATIILVVVGLKIDNQNIGFFFAGYFLFLLGNSLLPLVLKAQTD